MPILKSHSKVPCNTYAKALSAECDTGRMLQDYPQFIGIKNMFNKQKLSVAIHTDHVANGLADITWCRNVRDAESEFGAS
jgi:hypothetical protein